VVKNFENGYHGYWTSNFYELNEHFGSAKDLKNFIKKAHDKDIYVMVDVVANHVGYVPNGDDFSKVVPFNKKEHYHKACEIEDWENTWQLENCRLCGLPDLDQDNKWVRGKLNQWI
jgi:alpha-amylase